MMPSRIRRLRVLATVAVGIFMLWLWTRNSGMVDIYRQTGRAELAIGGGSVLRPDLQRPEMHERPEGDLREDDAHRPPNDKPPVADDLHTEPEPPAREPPSIDDLLHSPAGMQPKEPKEPVESPTTTSMTAVSASTKGTSQSSQPSVQPDTSEDDTGDNPNGFGYGRIEISEDPSLPTESAVHWLKRLEHFPITSTMQLPTGTSKPLPRIQREINKLSMYGADDERLETIKEAAVHSWKGYRLFAFQQDEIKPISHTASNPFNGWGATLVDSLDTLWIMGLEKEFEEAVQAVSQIDFKTSRRADIPLFETTIRYLGGLLAAYDVSGKQYITLLDKAVELAEVLYGAFDTPNRVPMTYYRWSPSSTNEPHRAGARVILAEVGTLSLEFTRLAQLTGEPKYYDAIARLTDMFEEWQNNTRLPGMFPTYFDASGCGNSRRSPSRTTDNQQPVADNNDHQEAHEIIANHEDIMKERHGHPGALPDDETSKPQEWAELYNEESHGNTWKRKRQIGDDEDRQISGEVVENGSEEPGDDTSNDEVSSDSGLDGHVVENSATNETVHEHELRTPQSPSSANIRRPVLPDENCVPQGFASFSATSQESFTLSGMSDSMYEYLPKEYILLGGQVDKYRTMYLDSAAVVIENLLYKPMTKDERDILMTGEMRIGPNYSQPTGERDYIQRFTAEGAHLACFSGGMFALAGVIFDKPEHVEIGSKLADGCVWMYNVTASGIMPEGATLMKCEDTWGKCEWNETAYWEALDPYEESRTGTRAASSEPDPPSPAPLDHVGSDDTSRDTDGEDESDDDSENDSEDDYAGKPDEPAHDEARDSGDTLTRRQLEVEDDEDEGSSEPPAPTPADAPSTTTRQRRPEYTPLSHKEFVEDKIEDERLPTGFVRMSSKKYILRPEAIESVFYMYRITGDPHWREVGWDMWTSIDRATRAAFGYSAIDDVTKEVPAQMDQMESFWLAETLKYFYLLYDDPARWSLDDWVLNTEAHLFRRPKSEAAQA